MDRVIITAAICGAEVTKEQNPAVPYTPAETAREAKRCIDAGASLIHLHVRTDEGVPTQDAERYREVMAAIRDECGYLPLIQPSTGGAVGMTYAERARPLELYPETATLDCGTLNFGEEVFMNTPEMMRAFASAMMEKKILPELECFEAGHVAAGLDLYRRGLLFGHLHFDFVMGVPGAMPAAPESLVFMKSMLPAGATWTAAGIGRHSLAVAMTALAAGGHVRVGLEDTIYYAKGKLSHGSAPLVERVARMARELGREPADCDEAREILEIPANRRELVKL